MQSYVLGREGGQEPACRRRSLSSAQRLGADSCGRGAGNALVPFDAGTIEALLSSERSSRPEEPHGATHVLSLCATPEGPGEIGVVVVNVRAGAVVGAAPGLLVSVSLDEEVFDTGADAFLRLVDACLDALSPDSVMVGPSDWLRELGAGWATFSRTAQRDLVPDGAVVVSKQGGVLILAHTEGPLPRRPLRAKPWPKWAPRCAVSRSRPR